MTASDFASLLGEHRWRKGKMLRCPAHGDRTPSLSIKDGDRGLMLKCQSQGCTVKEICAAVGIRVSDLFYDKASPQVRAHTSLREKKQKLERQLGLVMWLGALEKPAYWAAAERRIRGELQLVRCQLEPLEVYREIKGLSRAEESLWQSLQIRWSRWEESRRSTERQDSPRITRTTGG